MRRWLAAIVIVMASTAVLWAWPQRATTAGPPKNARFGNPNAYARNYENYLYGVIGKIGRDGIVLDKTKFGVPTTVSIVHKTKFIRDGKRSSLGKLKRGDMVYVQTKKNKKTGALTAVKVVSGAGATGGV
jgi:hypothetical protein